MKKDDRCPSWEFIMHAGTNLDWYGRGTERVLVDAKTLEVILYSAKIKSNGLDKMLITSGVVQKG